VCVCVCVFLCFMQSTLVQKGGVTVFSGPRARHSRNELGPPACPCSYAGYADLPLTLLGGPVDIGAECARERERERERSLLTIK
jgi:hypothetical protein